MDYNIKDCLRVIFKYLLVARNINKLKLVQFLKHINNKQKRLFILFHGPSNANKKKRRNKQGIKNCLFIFFNSIEKETKKSIMKQ